jgi:hypothetical protein
VQDLWVSDGQRRVLAGHRRCPDGVCQTHVFIVREGSKVLMSYPAETIDFDSSKIPAPITSAFEEAIMCHASQCFVASAIMVRKTLEELCRDRGAKGSSLKERVRNLGTIGQQELDVAIEFTKEVPEGALSVRESAG